MEMNELKKKVLKNLIILGGAISILATPTTLVAKEFVKPCHYKMNEQQITPLLDTKPKHNLK